MTCRIPGEDCLPSSLPSHEELSCEARRWAALGAVAAVWAIALLVGCAGGRGGSVGAARDGDAAADAAHDDDGGGALSDDGDARAPFVLGGGGGLGARGGGYSSLCYGRRSSLRVPRRC